MPLFYHVGLVGRERGKSRLEERIHRGEFVERSVAVESGRYKLVQNLQQEERRAKTCKHRMAVSTNIICVREKMRTAVFEPPTHTVINDIQGNKICTSYKTKRQKHNVDFQIGYSSHIAGVNVDCVETATQEGCLLRATAYLALEGRKRLKQFVIAQESEVYGRDLSQRRLQIRGTYDYNILGIPVTVDVRGRMTVFLEYPDLSEILVDETDLDHRELKRLRRFTHFTKLKRWIPKTTQDLNDSIGDAFRALAVIVAEVYPRT